MRLLIIGCGYLGNSVVAAWKANAQGEVFATTRNAEHARAFRDHYGIEPLICDVMQPAMLKLPEVDAVVHCVGLDRTAGMSMRDVYVQGLRNVLDALPAPGRLIYVSSTSVYGQTDGSWVDEESPTEPAEESGKVVLEAEQLLRSRLPEAIILRFAGIYGPGRLLRQRAVQDGQTIVGNSEKWLNLIHVEDGAQAVLAACKVGRPGVYNIADGCPVIRRELFSTLAELLAAPPPTFAVTSPDQSTPPHELSHRRIANRRMLQELKVHLRFGSFLQGLPASLRAAD